jgi:hypothetical protein
MTHTLRTLIAAGALLAAPALAPSLAQAQQANDGPRLVGSGESMTVEYGPGPRGNIVGGGPTVSTLGTDPHVTITYLDPTQVQHRADGRVPVLVGSGENTTVQWVDGPASQPRRMAGLGR